MGLEWLHCNTCHERTQVETKVPGKQICTQCGKDNREGSSYWPFPDTTVGEEKLENILPFTGLTSNPIPVDQVCDSAKNHKQVLILAYDDDKPLTIYSSGADNTFELIGRLEHAKAYLLHGD